MVPIYDTDLAEERWSRTEWEHYELWEKLEVRLRRKQRLWILGTAILFFTLFSIPIVAEQQPKRATLSSVRQLAREISVLKLEASIQHTALSLRFAEDGSLKYSVFRVPGCSSSDPGVLVRTGELAPSTDLVLLTQRSLPESSGTAPAFSGLTDRFCYDSLAGSATAPQGAPLEFMIVPRKDLEENRFDRLSMLTLRGSSADISFE